MSQTALVGAGVFDGSPQLKSAELVISGERIAEIAANGARSSSGPARVIDLSGCCLLPGFIDAHIHPLSWSRRLSHVDFSGAGSVEALLELLTGNSRSAGSGSWIVGAGLLPAERLAERRLPTLAEVDAASAGNGLFIAGGSGALVNSFALRAASLPLEGGPVPGGMVAVGDDGRASGLLLGRGATDRVRHLLPRPTPAQDKASLRAFLDLLASHGITALTEYGSVDYDATFAEDLAVYESLLDDGGLPLKCRIAYQVPTGKSVDDAVAELSESGVTPSYDATVLRPGPIKLFTDGGVQGALLRGPYVGKPDYRGISLVERDDLMRLSRYAAESNWQLSIHALGGEAIAKALSVWREIDRELPIGSRRFSLQHAFDPTDADMTACRSLGVVVGVHQSLFYKYSMEMQRSWGESARAELNPVRSWLDAGVALAGGSDVAPHEPLTAIRGLCTRATESGEVLGASEAVTPAEAVKIHTLGAAYGMFDDVDTGSLHIGKAADIVVLASDTLSCDPSEIAAIPVLATFMNGRLTFVSDEAPDGLRGLGE